MTCPPRLITSTIITESGNLVYISGESSEGTTHILPLLQFKFDRFFIVRKKKNHARYPLDISTCSEQALYICVGRHYLSFRHQGLCLRTYGDLWQWPSTTFPDSHRSYSAPVLRIIVSWYYPNAVNFCFVFFFVLYIQATPTGQRVPTTSELSAEKTWRLPKNRQSQHLCALRVLQQLPHVVSSHALAATS